METKAKVKKTTSKKAVSKPKKTIKKSVPTFEQIQQRAYQIYLEKGKRGSDLENWLQAEKELNK